ncbi:MAG TPA: divalent-cation tolerance protein CutA [Verrucomicrobiales bacterium]|nr:divalent-cation tolerance protein CutA [Verrucomicrobiales bacterium]
MTGPADHSLILVLSTFPGAESAERVARILLEERLVACANLLPGLRSLYRWEGTLHDDPECLALFKSSAASGPALEQRLQELHPYDVPEIVILEAAGVSPGYLQWVLQSLAEPSSAAR